MPKVIVPVQRAKVGAHFHGYGLRTDQHLISPFIGVDHYWMTAPTFAPHHHAGISALSYLLGDSETGMANRDSIGTQNIISPGGLHWTTAGRGVTHEEVPAQSGKTVHGLQIFVALAQSKQGIAPFPLILESQAVPVVNKPGAIIRVPLGQYDGVRSPLDPPTEVTMLDINLDAGAELCVPVTEGHCMFVLPITGTVKIDGQLFDREDLKVPIFKAQDKPLPVIFKAPHGRAQAVLFSGPPLPFV